MQISHIIKKYDEKTVVNDVSFSLPKGKVTSLIGPNGAGKSTVMSIISRLIAPDNGSVVIEKKDINKWNSKELSKHLAILTQTNNIQMKLTVEELVAFGRFPHSGGRLNSKDKEMIDKAIDYMELETFRERFIDELSGGQRQRVSIARALMRNPEVIVLDEATSALDSISEKLIQEALNNLTKDRTTFIVAHRLSTIKGADRIAVIADGHCVEYGTYDELMELKGEFYQMKSIQS